MKINAILTLIKPVISGDAKHWLILFYVELNLYCKSVI
jgi:hypothetical protein